MKFNKTLASIAAAAAMLVAPLASQAAVALQIKISDGFLPDLIISDDGAGDAVAGLGTIFYTGTFGDWTVTTGLGSNAGDPLEMHFTSSVVRVGNAPRILSIELTATGLAFPGSYPSAVGAHADGGGSGDGIGSWAAYLDMGNVAFGTSDLIHSAVGYTTSGGNGSAVATGLYSATLRTVYDFTAVGSGGHQASLDLDFDVPEPGSLALAGLALVGLAAARRRKA